MDGETEAKRTEITQPGSPSSRHSACPLGCLNKRKTLVSLRRVSAKASGEKGDRCSYVADKRAQTWVGVNAWALVGVIFLMLFNASEPQLPHLQKGC